jgi:hypothetical protein
MSSDCLPHQARAHIKALHRKWSLATPSKIAIGSVEGKPASVNVNMVGKPASVNVNMEGKPASAPTRERSKEEGGARDGALDGARDGGGAREEGQLLLQAADGQLIFADMMCTRMLLDEFGSVSSCPELVRISLDLP